ncbi:hypothetical protein KC19_1G121600 [Ceratodon purpureus]|uniref:Uncharacterized protein n=1 Tax=Ceratodon purpureus TaxID=3225 RepID=A0A8T0J660_CERPU|nr:hypothetical protein KC19_1G121600 [Ceratodon purpureus]
MITKVELRRIFWKQGLQLGSSSSGWFPGACSDLEFSTFQASGNTRLEAGEPGSGSYDVDMAQHPVWVSRLALGGAALLVLGVTTYDIHRSIEANQTPPTEEQVAALAAQIEESRQSRDPPSKGPA